jgi:membrane protease YdiL (CAAX protease family)
MTTNSVAALDDTKRRHWTVVGLVVAFFAMPLVLALFSAAKIPWTIQNVLLRELALFAAAAGVAFIIRRKEHLGWDSVGLQRPELGKTALWVLLTMVGAALAVALAFGLIKLFKLPMGSSDSAKYDLLPTWVLLVALVRAGFIEEFFYRGYAIERLQSLTGRRFLAAAIPLFFFAVFHYRQGWAGIIVALLSGAVLTGVYLLKRNLWVNITAHFLVDFIPNIVVPLFTAK